MEIITTNAKKKVKIVPASFREQLELKNEFWKVLQANPEITSIFKDNDNSFECALKGILFADTSDNFIDAIFRCLESCVYEDVKKIDKLLFEDVPELREDYYEILVECCKVNLNPFFKSLASAFTKLLELTPSESQK